MAVSEHVSPEDAWDYVGNPRYTVSDNRINTKFCKTISSALILPGLATSPSPSSAAPTRPRRLRFRTARPLLQATTSTTTRAATPPPRRGSGHQRTPAVPPLPPRVRFVQTHHSMAITHTPLAFSSVFRKYTPFRNPFDVKIFLPQHH
jgi:hypothetical protein